VTGRKFDVTEYGMCFVEDLLDDIPESVIRVSTDFVGVIRSVITSLEILMDC